jgi:hypothetical protein
LATVKTAVATTATATGATSTAAMLAKGAMKAMYLAKVKMVAAVAAASLVVAGGGAIVAQEVAERKAAEQPPAMVVQPAVNVDEIDLMTVKSLTPAQAAAIVKRQEGKPSLPDGIEKEDAALRAAGATPEQIQRLGTERQGAYFNLREFLGCTVEPEWFRLGNRFREFLALPALTALTPEVAAELTKFNGHHLSLSGLTTLSADAAKAVAQFKEEGGLHLNGLTTLSAAATKGLAEFKGQLTLGGPGMLAVCRARTVAEFKCGVLFLNGITSLSTTDAKALAEFKVSLLAINDLTTLSAETAKALAEFRGHTLQIRVPTLSAEAAKALAEFKGALLLPGLTTLSPEAAAALAAKVELPPNLRPPKP